MLSRVSPDNWLKCQLVSIPLDYMSNAYQDLVAKYSQARRHYHNLDHIASCLTHFDQVRNLAEQPLAVEMALWFHDVIYEPGAQINEVRSAEYACKYLVGFGLEGYGQFILHVTSLICSTDHVRSFLPDIDHQLIRDIDLISLGVAPKLFESYGSKVRAECISISDRTFHFDRVAFMEHLLGREHIYFTEYFRDRYEQQARENLTALVCAK